MSIRSTQHVPTKPSAQRRRSSSARKAGIAKAARVAKKASTSTAKAASEAASSKPTLGAKLFKAAYVAGSALSQGEDPQATAQETVKYLREQPEALKAFDEATTRFDAWLAHRNSTLGRKAAGAAAPLIRDGLTDKAMEASVKAAAGEDSRRVFHHAINGLFHAGIPGALSSLAKLPETFKPTGARMGQLTEAMAQATAAVPGLKSATMIAQGKNVGLDLLLAFDDFRDASIPKGKRAGELIKATANAAMWVMTMCAKVAPEVVA